MCLNEVMEQLKIPRRITTAILNSLNAGVVPRIGLEYIAVGRKDEIAALLDDLESVSQGGATFRFIIGRYGSGKSFMLQLLRNYALERGFVVADADLSPERHLAGSSGEGLATYREMMKSISTKTRPDGGALQAILERWISDQQAQVRGEETKLDPASEEFSRRVEARIHEVANQMEGLVHGFDFASVLSSYWRGFRNGEDSLKDAAFRWLRGEYNTKVEARQDLGVRVIIDDAGWYDYLKLMACFTARIGYRGFLLLFDEAANLYKISHSVSRLNNYEKLLAIFNDSLQGKVEHLGVLVAGTPQFLEDPRRGLYSYEAFRSRLAESRFLKEGMKDSSGPVIRLKVLTPEEVYVLLDRLQGVYCSHYSVESFLSSEQLTEFMQEIANRLGAEHLLTPREVVRDFLAVLDILRQNSQVAFDQLIHGEDFRPSREKEVESGELAEFKL